MREFAIKIDVSDIPYLVDIVGTGGDGQNLFNVSTASAFVIAAAGATIANMATAVYQVSLVLLTCLKKQRSILI